MRSVPVAKDVAHWLARLEPGKRAALEKLRGQILAAAPGAEEVISYGLPTFKLHGHLVAFGAFTKHLSFFPMSSTLIATYPEAAAFLTSTGTMQFQPGKPIPARLVTRIVKARLAENLARVEARAKAAATKKAAAKPRPGSKTRTKR